MLNLGILGGADIAFRNFLPALAKVEGVRCAGVASNNPERRERFAREFGVPVRESYDELLADKDVDIIYLPLPPALHFAWGRRALEAGKHLFLEKPSTTNADDSRVLAELAATKGLALQENYMFQYHGQIKFIMDLVAGGAIGEPRLVRGMFAFPMRPEGDFRYDKALGGGALMDTGGYVLKLATIMLGPDLQLTGADEFRLPGAEIDISGAVTLKNPAGIVFQGYFGMDNCYQCSLEIFGTRGSLVTKRIFTAPAGFRPTVFLETNEEKKTFELDADNHFETSIRMFVEAVGSENVRSAMRSGILLQAGLVDEVKKTWSE